MLTALALTIPSVVWLVVSVLVHAVGEYYSKVWANGPAFSYALIAASAYALSGFFWLPMLLHRNNLAVMGTVWLLFATLAPLIIGVFIFGEQLSLTDAFGIALAIGAMIVLSL